MFYILIFGTLVIFFVLVCFGLFYFVLFCFFNYTEIELRVHIKSYRVMLMRLERQKFSFFLSSIIF